MRAIRMTLSLCHSVADEHDLIVDVESRPERRRQEYIRALLVMGLQSSFEGTHDLRPSGAAARTHRLVIHLNKEIPTDGAILRFVEGGAAPVRRAELLRRLLVRARHLYTPNAAAAPSTSLGPAPKPRLSNAEQGVREPALSRQSTSLRSTEIDFVLPDDEEATTPTPLLGVPEVTHGGSTQSGTTLVAEVASVEAQPPSELPVIDDGMEVGGKLSDLAGLFK